MECLLLSMALVDAPGTYRLPSERSIVEETGISLITVQRALTELADRALIERRKGSGNYPARKPTLEDLLANVKIEKLAMYSDQTFHSSTMLRYDLLFFIQQRLVSHGTDLLLFNEGGALNELKNRKIEGVFICGRDFPIELHKSKIPRVQITAHPTGSMVDIVRLDLESAGLHAGHEITREGRQHIAMFGSTGIEENISRQLFAETRRHLSSKCHISEKYGDSEAIYRHARKWLQQSEGKRLHAISGFYLCTASLIRACEAEGRKIGQDVLLLAFGSNNIVFEDVVAMQTLHADRRLMADLALLQMLLRIMAPTLPAREVTVPFGLS